MAQISSNIDLTTSRYDDALFSICFRRFPHTKHTKLTRLQEREKEKAAKLNVWHLGAWESGKKLMI